MSRELFLILKKEGRVLTTYYSSGKNSYLHIKNGNYFICNNFEGLCVQLFRYENQEEDIENFEILKEKYGLGYAICNQRVKEYAYRLNSMIGLQ